MLDGLGRLKLACCGVAALSTFTAKEADCPSGDVIPAIEQVEIQ